MCFSASASFSASVVLLGLGALAVKSARSRRELPFAAIPLGFALQQFVEGVVWSTFDPSSATLNAAMTYAYVMFSHILWPVYVPWTVLLLEPEGWRRGVLRMLTATGAALAAWLLFDILHGGVTSAPVGRHIEYVLSESHPLLATFLYASTTAFGLLLSSHPRARLFGALTLLAFGVTYAFYETWLISVWCYFAALLSAVVLLHFHARSSLREQALR